MRVLRKREDIQTRALAAFRLVDGATGADLDARMTIRAMQGDAAFVRNSRGLQVLAFWGPLSAHRDAFASPPPAPAVGSQTLQLAVEDPLGEYLPRLVSVALPRDPDPAHAAQADSLFSPVVVHMYPASSVATGANWSVLRVSLVEDGSGDALGGALLRVIREGNVIARGLTDGRGEALVPVIGVPVMTFGDDDDAVIVSTIGVSLEVAFDPAIGTRLASTALQSGVQPPTPVVDPTDLEDRFNQLPNHTRALQIAARRSLSVAMTLELP